MTRRSRSCRTRWATSTTGCLCGGRRHRRSRAGAARRSATRPRAGSFGAEAPAGRPAVLTSEARVTMAGGRGTAYVLLAAWPASLSTLAQPLACARLCARAPELRAFLGRPASQRPAARQGPARRAGRAAAAARRGAAAGGARGGGRAAAAARAGGGGGGCARARAAARQQHAAGDRQPQHGRGHGERGVVGRQRARAHRAAGARPPALQAPGSPRCRCLAARARAARGVASGRG